MTTKELRQSLRRGSFVIPFLAIQLLAVLAMVAEFQLPPSPAGPAEASGMLNIHLLWASGPFWIVVSCVCLLLMPMTGLLLMREEVEEGNHELLLLTKLSRWRIVFGKFMMLWGLSALTFCSLLPYVVVRYLAGGIEWWRELACASTVLGGSAILAAGAIGASAFRGIGLRVLVLFVFVGSLLFSGAIALLASAAVTEKCGVIYHLNAVAVVVCYVTIGMALARTQLRLATFAYEVRPGGLMIVIVAVTPVVIGFTALMSLGYLSLIGLLLMAFAAAKLDVVPKVAVKAVPDLPAASP